MEDEKCQHERTRVQDPKVVGEGVYRHLVRKEVCVNCGEVVAIW